MRRRARSRRGARHAVALLSVANLWSAGTTFVSFALVARAVSRTTLGHYSLGVAVAALAAQLVDSGSGLLMTRDAAQSRQPYAVLGRSLASRLRVTAVSVPAAIALLLGLHVPVAAVVVAAVLVLVQSLYGFVVLTDQALGTYRQLVGSQLLNGSVFLVAAGAFLLLSRSASAAQALLIPVVGLGAVLLARAGRLAACWRERGHPALRGEPGKELNVLRVGAVSNALAGNLDQVVLGMAGPTVVASYAAAQRPAYGLASLSTALSNVLLRVAATGDARGHARLLRWGRRGWLVAPLGGLAAWGFGLVFLPLLYGRPDTASAVVFGALVAAYLVGAASTGASSVLLAHRRGDLLAVSSVVQAVLVMLGAAVGADAHEPLLVAVSVLVGRGFALAWMTWWGARCLRAPAVGVVGVP